MVYVKNDDVVEYPPCRAPLRNGRLCPRRDAEKCPFHGIIVPRDEFGIPLDGIPTNPPKQKQTWELIAGDIVVERPKRSKTKLEPIVKKSSVQKRLLRKSNRLSKNAPVDPTPDYVERDRNAFRW
jgi:hypothetical protein